MASHSSVRAKSQIFESTPKSVSSSPVVTSKRPDSRLTSPSDESKRLQELESKVEKQTKQILADSQRIKQLELETRTSEARYLNLVASLRDIGLDAEDILQNGAQKPKKRGSFLSPAEPPGEAIRILTDHSLIPDALSSKSKRKVKDLQVESHGVLQENNELKLANERLRKQVEEITEKLTTTQTLLEEALRRADDMESLANDQISVSNSRSFDADR